LPPIFPFSIYLIFLLFGKSILAIRLANVLFSLITIIFIYLTSKRILKTKWAPYIITIIASLYPGLISWTGYEITDSLFAMVCAVVLYLLLAVFQPKLNLKKVFLLGLFVGFANLVRGNLVFLPIFITPALLLTYKAKKGIIATAFFAFAVAIPLLTWGTRNQIVYHHFVPIASHGGTALYYGNNPFAFTKKFHTSISNDVDRDFLEGANKLGPWESGIVIQKKATDYILKYPKRFVLNSLKRFTLYLRPVPINSIKPYFLKKLSLDFEKVIYYGFIIGVAIYVCDVFKRKINFTKFSLMTALFLAVSASYSITAVIPSARYRLPLMGIEIIMLGYALERIFGVLLGGKGVSHPKQKVLKLRDRNR
jgi:hypothetical protein